METYDSFLQAAADAYKIRARKQKVIIFILIAVLIVLSLEDNLFLNWLTLPTGIAAFLYFCFWSADSIDSDEIKHRYARGLPLSREPHHSDSEAERLVREYGRLLQKAAGKVVCEARLPATKRKIKQAIVIAMGATNDEQMKEYLRESYLSLSVFQPVWHGFEDVAASFAIEERLILSRELTQLGLSR